MTLGCFAKVGQAAIITLNSFFLVLALGVTVIGGMIIFAPDTMSSILQGMVGMLSDMTGGIGDIDLSTLDLKDIVGGADIALMAGGIGLMAIAGTGILGSKKKIYCLLIVYGLLVILVVAGEVVAGWLFTQSSQQISDSLRSSMRSALLTHYYGANSSDIVTVIMDLLMINLHCCGIDGFSDFNESESWYRNRSDDDYPNRTIVLTTPLACCKDQSAINDSWAVEECALYPNEENSNFNLGCYDLAIDMVIKYIGVVYGLVSTVGVFELSLIIFAFWLARSAKKEKKEEEEEAENEETEENETETDTLNPETSASNKEGPAIKKQNSDKKKQPAAEAKKQKNKNSRSQVDNERLSIISSLLSTLHTERPSSSASSARPTTLQTTYQPSPAYKSSAPAVQIIPAPTIPPMLPPMTHPQVSCYACGSMHQSQLPCFPQPMPLLHPIYLPPCSTPAQCYHHENERCSRRNQLPPPPYPGSGQNRHCQCRNEIPPTSTRIRQEPESPEARETSVVCSRASPPEPEINGSIETLNVSDDMDEKKDSRTSLYDRRGSAETNPGRLNRYSSPSSQTLPEVGAGQSEERFHISNISNLKKKGQRLPLGDIFKSNTFSASMSDMSSTGRQNERKRKEKTFITVRL